MPRNYISLFGSGGEDLPATSSFDAESLAIFAAMTTPPVAQRKTDIDTCVKALKAAGVWVLLDRLWVLAANDTQAALLNWINPSVDPLIPASSPTFTSDRGYTGNGSNMALNNTTLYTGFSNFSQNSTSLCAWVRSSGVNGCMGQPTNTYIGLEPTDATNCRVSLNNQFSSISTIANTVATGFFHADRPNSSTVQVFLNGSSIGSVTKATDVVQADTVCVLQGQSAFFTGQVSAASVGASLAGNAAAYYSAMQAYMTAVGAYP